MRALFLALAVFLSGCASWDYYECADLCRSCGVVECGVFCGRLDDRFADPECAPAAQVAWNCTQAIGCDFPLQCQASLTEARECGRD